MSTNNPHYNQPHFLSKIECIPLRSFGIDDGFSDFQYIFSLYQPSIDLQNNLHSRLARQIHDNLVPMLIHLLLLPLISSNKFANEIFFDIIHII